MGFNQRFLNAPGLSVPRVHEEFDEPWVPGPLQQPA